MDFALWLILIVPLLTAMFISKVTGGKVSSVLLKGSITYLVFVTAVAGLKSGGNLPMGGTLAAAMAVFVLADVLLDIRFIPGMAAFAAGHGLLIWWIVGQNMLSWVSLPIAMVLYGLVVFAFRRNLKSMGKLFVPFLIYPTVLMGMTAMAVVLPVLGGIKYLPFAAGAVLFTGSDLMLAANMMIRLPRKWSIVSFAMYYAAIFLMALSCWVIF